MGLSTENPPHTQKTIFFPIKGMEDRIFVITVAPQNDICPQGRTYPINAEAIIKINIIFPEIHIFFLLKDLLSKDFKI